MANDRMYIKCKICNEDIVIAALRRGVFWSCENKDLSTELNTFFEKHDNNCFLDEENYPEGERRYIIEYET